MSETFDVAVVGATGILGEALVELLEEREFPIAAIHLLASGDSIGKSVQFRERNVRVRDVAAFDFSTTRLAFFCTAADVALEHAPRALAAGCSAIDMSGAFPADQAPVVQMAADEAAVGAIVTPALVATPCAPAAEIAEVLAALRSHLSIERLVVMACL